MLADENIRSRAESILPTLSSQEIIFYTITSTTAAASTVKSKKIVLVQFSDYI